MRHTLETIIMLAATLAIVVAAASGAEPRAIFKVTEHPGGLYALDATASTGGLTWDFGTEKPIFDTTGHRAAVYAKPGQCVVLVASVGEKVSIRVVHLGQALPVDDLAAKVRKLSRLLPADERAKVAEIHAKLGTEAANGTITSEAALFVERRVRVNAAMPDGRDAGWDEFFSDTNDLLDAFSDSPEAGVDGKASSFEVPFRQLAEGLR